MNHISKHIILAVNIYSIIFESCSINLHICTRKHFNNSCFQTIIIHINQRSNCFIRCRFGPITFKFSFQHHTYNRSRIINLIILQKITIIPAFDFIKILMIFLRKFLYFILRKTNIRSQIARTQHCKLIKIIQCRLCFFFFYRKNTCKISKLNVFSWFSSFKHSPQEIDIRLLNLSICCRVSNQNIPFINNDNKLLSGFFSYNGKCIR